MAVVRAHEASSSSMPPRPNYHVFLSFRGEDTRLNFTDHLHSALVGAGFRTFRDDDDIERGEKIKLELERGIQESRCSIIVFSKDYASSSWCLDELVMILEFKKNSKHHYVLPVFYDVDPSNVGKQKESFAEAFVKHEDRCKLESEVQKRKEMIEKVRGWRKALQEVVGLAGMVLQNQADKHESKFIKKIINVIGNKLNRTILSTPPHLIGIHSRVEKINLWLNDGLTDAQIMVIRGMSGIGKTTIAKHIFNSKVANFEGGSFLSNVREKSEKSDGLISLQRQLLLDILKRRKVEISNVDEGVNKIKDAIYGKRVLIILDGVDNLADLNAILGMRDWFSLGSKIIITTTCMRLLPKQENYKIYNVEKFLCYESIELFSWHAFGQDHPIDAYMKFSKDVVEHCGGLPLALEVLGASLNGRGVDEWESALKKLKAIPDGEIVKRLKIGYDLLDDYDKNLFLDIVCFFIGEKKDAVTILDGCDFYTTIGIQNLVDRCLLTIDKYHGNRLKVHQLLRDMGREIIRMESPKEPGQRSRSWNPTDSFDVLKESTGTETVEGLVLGTDALGTSPYLPSGEDDFKTDAFARMRKLRLLKITKCHLSGGYKDFPRKLKWLYWDKCPLQSIPSDFPLEKVVVLEMCNSKLKQLCNRRKFLGALKVLNLTNSHSLTRSPNFLDLPNLERLILENCASLTEVHESIGKLEDRLVVLNVKDCIKLQKLPKEISLLKVLEILIISGCSNLVEFPTDFRKLESLKVFDSNGVPINPVVFANTVDTSWHGLIWSFMYKLRKIPQLYLDTSWRELIWSFLYEPRKIPQLHFPCSLVTLSLEGCNLFDDSFPRECSSMHLLKRIRLSNNLITCLPDFIKQVTTELEELRVNSCTRLQTLIGIPHLQRLFAKHCPLLEKLTFSCYPLECELYGSENVVEADGLFKMVPMENTDAEIINNFGLYDMESLKGIEVEWCTRIIGARKKGPIKVQCENGHNFNHFLPGRKISICNIFFPGSKVPAWYHIKAAGSSTSFSLASHNNLKILALKVCYVYAINHRNWTPKKSLNLGIINKTKRKILLYCPISYALPGENEYMIWLSHLRLEDDELEAGDELIIKVLNQRVFMAKEIGIRFVFQAQAQEQMGNWNANWNAIGRERRLEAQNWNTARNWNARYWMDPGQNWNARYWMADEIRWDRQLEASEIGVHNIGWKRILDGIDDW